MFSDTILTGVFIFFASIGVLGFFFLKIENSKLSYRTKSVLTYTAILILVGVVVWIFDNHSSTYLAKYNSL